MGKICSDLCGVFLEVKMCTAFQVLKVQAKSHHNRGRGYLIQCPPFQHNIEQCLLCLTYMLFAENLENNKNKNLADVISLVFKDYKILEVAY